MIFSEGDILIYLEKLYLYLFIYLQTLCISSEKCNNIARLQLYLTMINTPTHLRAASTNLQLALFSIQAWF